MNRKLKRLFFNGTYRSFGNLARFFMRMFAGILFLQFGIRQMTKFDELVNFFPEVFGMSSQTSLTLMITIEVLCSVLIIFGFCTRIAAIFPMVSMLIAEYFVYFGKISAVMMMGWTENAFTNAGQLGFVPIMFVGMFFFIVLAGPGKVSVDYLMLLYFTNKENLNELNL